MSEVRDKIATITLPDGFELGDWSGDYAKLLFCGEPVGQLGGLLVKVTPETDLPKEMTAECWRELLKNCRSQGKGWRRGQRPA